MIDCRVYLAGAPLPDTAGDLAAGSPTALADVELIWGRGSPVDQPGPATTRIVVMDPVGGTDFFTAIPIGAVLEMFAAGDVSTGAPVDVATDGGFETLALGAPSNRVAKAPGSSATLTVVAAPVHAGARAIAMTTAVVGPANTVYVPPAPFNTTNPAAWDAIPTIGDAAWTWSVAVLGARNGDVAVSGLGFRDAADVTASAGTIGPTQRFYGDGTFHVLADTVTATPAQRAYWLGVAVGVTLASWNTADAAGPPLTWETAPDTWNGWATTVIDDQSIMAPATGLTRDVLVFSGRVTDMVAGLGFDGTARVEVVATDQLADLNNRYVGDVPWPAETVAARFGKIIAASGAEVETRLDNPLAGTTISRRDVDNQPAGGMMTEIAAGVDGVLWSATHSTTGPYLWLENPMLRAQVGALTLVGGVVVITVGDPGNRAPGRTTIDGCDVESPDVTWTRDVADVITRVDATWLDQSTSPEPTEAGVRVVDAPGEAAYGARRMGVTTPLTTATAATNVANRILARSRDPQWRVQNLTYDVGRFPPAPGTETADVLDLLDGTTRLGRGLIVTNVAHWPGGEALGLYVDGGVYRYDAEGWALGLFATPMTGFGLSSAWDDLDPTWTWTMFDPAIAWTDLFGVAGPLAELEAA